ncbi:MAG: hypothetical protein ACO3TX_12790 [Pseudomonadales bacterium]|nr:hypothetical protein [Gammaproteobacteria bacterium]
MADRAALGVAIEQVEEAYEYMLAYAAQGRSQEGAGPGGANIRDYLGHFISGAETLATWYETDDRLPANLGSEMAKTARLIVDVLQTLLASQNISSEKVDNTNALILMREFLTEVFFADKVLITKD